MVAYSTKFSPILVPFFRSAKKNCGKGVAMMLNFHYLQIRQMFALQGGNGMEET
jgi:hypothetical protein